jgi:hypothetical protein
MVLATVTIIVQIRKLRTQKFGGSVGRGAERRSIPDWEFQSGKGLMKTVYCGQTKIEGEDVSGVFIRA